MKNEYVAPVIEIVYFDLSDVKTDDLSGYFLNFRDTSWFNS